MPCLSSTSFCVLAAAHKIVAAVCQQSIPDQSGHCQGADRTEPLDVMYRLPLVRGSRAWRKDVPSRIITEFWSDPDKLTKQVQDAFLH